HRCGQHAMFASSFDIYFCCLFFFFFQAEDGIRDLIVTGFRRVLFRSPYRAPERERVARGVDDHGVTLDELVLEQPEGERVLNQALDGALERPRPKRRVVALPAEERLGRVGDIELDALGPETPLEVAELDLDDPSDLRAPERVEDHDLVDPVEELRPQRGAELLHEELPRLLGTLI